MSYIRRCQARDTHSLRNTGGRRCNLFLGYSDTWGENFKKDTLIFSQRFIFCAFKVFISLNHTKDIYVESPHGLLRIFNQMGGGCSTKEIGYIDYILAF